MGRLLEKEKIKRDRRAKRAIETLRACWSDDPFRKQKDIDALVFNLNCQWPFRINTPEQIAQKEEAMRKILAKGLRGDGLREV